MKSRILVSMLVVALSAALVGGATFAWFTDSAESTSNTISAGTVDVSLDLKPQLPLDVEFDNLAPGDSFTYNLEIKNEGSLDMFYRFYLDARQSDRSSLEHALQVEVTKVGGSEDLVYQGSLSGLVGVGAAKQDQLASGETHNYVLRVNLPTSTGDMVQGKSFTSKLVVDAVQSVHQDGDIVWENE